DDEIAHHEHRCGGNDLVERVLHEAFEPTPEEPFEFRDDEKRYEDGPYENADCLCDEAIGGDDDGYGFPKRQDHEVNDVSDVAGKIGQPRGLNLPLVLIYGVGCVLQLGACEEITEVRSLVNDEVVEAATESGNRSGVVLRHGKAESDHHDQSSEVAELEPSAAIGGTESGLGPKPDDHDGGEGKEHALAEEGELANVLGEQLCDEGGNGVQLTHMDVPFLP